MWLILGGTGQLGMSLSKVLTERKIDFVAWGSQELDIQSSELCLQRIQSLSPSVIFNAAAWTDVDGAETNQDEAYAVNALGALNLAKSAKSVGAIFIQISTDYVFSGKSDVPWKVDDLRAPATVYGSTKAAGEVAVLSEYPERSYIFRTAWLYSPWRKNFVKTMVKIALSGESEVKVVDDQVGQPTSALDVANQIVDSVNAHLPFGIYHATNTGHANWYEFAQEIFKLVGSSGDRVLPIHSSSYTRPAVRPSFSVLDHDGWLEVSTSGVMIPKMRDWHIALEDSIHAISAMVEAKGEES